MGDDFFILDLGLHVIDCIRAFHLQMDAICRLGLPQRSTLTKKGWIFVRERVRDFDQRMVEEDVVDSMEMNGSGLVDLGLEQKLNHWERWKKQKKKQKTKKKTKDSYVFFCFCETVGFQKKKEKIMRRKKIGTKKNTIYY